MVLGNEVAQFATILLWLHIVNKFPSLHMMQ